MSWFDILKTPFDARQYGAELQSKNEQATMKETESRKNWLKKEMQHIDARLKRAMGLNPVSDEYKISINKIHYKRMLGLVEPKGDTSALEQALEEEYNMSVEIQPRMLDTIFIFSK